MDLFAFPALGPARQDALAGTFAEIGLQQVLCRPLHVRHRRQPL
jgi:hypothetical protein